MRRSPAILITFILCTWLLLPNSAYAQFNIANLFGKVSEVSFSSGCLSDTKNPASCTQQRRPGVSLSLTYGIKALRSDSSLALGADLTYSEYRAAEFDSELGFRGSVRELPALGVFVSFRTQQFEGFRLVGRAGYRMGLVSLHNAQIVLPPNEEGLQTQYTGKSDTFETGSFASAGISRNDFFTVFVEISLYLRDFESIVWSGTSVKEIPESFPLTLDLSGRQLRVGVVFQVN